MSARLLVVAATPCTTATQVQQQLPQIKRRHVVTVLPSLLGLAAAGAALGPAPAALAASSPAAADAAAAAAAAAAGAAAPLAPSSLAARIMTQGNVQQPGLMPPWAPKQLYFPRWLFGEWQVEMEFTGLSVPLGREYVPADFLQAAEVPADEGGVGSRNSFARRYFSTFPDTFENNMIMNLGLGMPHDAIIGDRAFNTRQTTNAFLGWDAVESVEYDVRDAPLRETVTLSRLAPDMAPLPPRRLQLYINNLSQEDGEDGAFYTSELCRQVMLGVRQAEVKDYEIITSYRQIDASTIAGRQRSCLYLQPQEALYFKAFGRAVAVYDYEFSMKRVAPEADAPAGAVACVPTPKDVIQCI